MRRDRDTPWSGADTHCGNVDTEPLGTQTDGEHRVSNGGVRDEHRVVTTQLAVRATEHRAQEGG